MALVLVLIGCWVKLECYSNERITKKANILIEYAYFEGQKDAIENKIQIKKVYDSTYIWIGSPWNDKRVPKYNPNISVEENIELIK